MRKNIQISYELFISLVKYFSLEQYNLYDDIEKDLQLKLDRLVLHDIYTKSKTGRSEEEKEMARKQYLDKVGIAESFRW